MKILKYLLIILVLLIVGFFLLGIFKSQVSYDDEIIVDKPIAEAWSVTQDPEKLKDWLTGFEKYEPVSGTPGTVGAVSNVYFIENGKSIKIQETITDIIPNESISMTFSTDFMNMDYTMHMSPEGNKTKISTSTTAKGTNPINKSMMALMASAIASQEDTNLAKLKTTIETNTKAY